MDSFGIGYGQSDSTDRNQLVWKDSKWSGNGQVVDSFELGYGQPGSTDRQIDKLYWYDFFYTKYC